MRSGCTWLLVMSASVLAAGCSLSPPRPDTDAVLAKLTGSAESIVVVADGMPLDAGGTELQTLSQTEAIRFALATNPAIQSGLARVRLAYAESKQARLLPNPVLSVVLKIPTSGGSPTVEPNLAADLLAILQKPNEAATADHRLRAASADAVTIVLDAVAKVEEIYTEAQALEALEPVLRERKNLITRLADIAKARLRGGEGTRHDVASIEAQSVELDIEIAETVLALREARLELANLIGRPSDGALWKLEPVAEPVDRSGEVMPWLQAGLENRPEIVAKTWELAALGAEFKRARWDLLSGTEVGAAGEGKASAGANDWAIGPTLAVPIPIFDWGQAKIEAAKAKRSDAAHQLTQIRRQVVEEVRRAHVVFASSYRTYQRVSDELIPLLSKRRDLSESQYKAGIGDVEALITAHQELQAALAKQVDLRKKTSIAFTRLQRAAGGKGVAPDMNEVK